VINNIVTYLSDHLDTMKETTHLFHITRALPMKTTTIIIAALASLLAAASRSTGSNTTADTTTAATTSLTVEAALCRRAVPAFNTNHLYWHIVEITDFQSDQIEIMDGELLCQAQSMRSLSHTDVTEVTAFYCLSLPIDDRKENFVTFLPEDCLPLLRENDSRKTLETSRLPHQPA